MKNRKQIINISFNGTGTVTWIPDGPTPAVALPSGPLPLGLYPGEGFIVQLYVSSTQETMLSLGINDLNSKEIFNITSGSDWKACGTNKFCLGDQFTLTFERGGEKEFVVGTLTSNS